MVMSLSRAILASTQVNENPVILLNRDSPNINCRSDKPKNYRPPDDPINNSPGLQICYKKENICDVEVWLTLGVPFFVPISVSGCVRNVVIYYGS